MLHPTSKKGIFMKTKYNIAMKKAVKELFGSQEGLSLAIEINRNTLSLIITGRLLPTDIEEQKIAGALNLSIEEVFGQWRKETKTLF